MMRDYYTLFHLSLELQNLKDAIVVECFTQEENCLFLQFYDGENLSTLQFSAKPNLEALFLRTAFSKATSNYKDLFPELIGEKCENISLVEGDRVLTLKFSKFDLWFVLFGGSKTNSFLIDDKKNIINSFLKPKVFKGKMLDEVLKNRIKKKIITVSDYIVYENYFSKEMSRFYLKRYLINSDEILDNLGESGKKRLQVQLQEFIETIKNSKQFFVYFENHKYFVSPIEINGLLEIGRFSSPSHAIFSAYVKTIKYLKAKEKYLKSFRKLEKELNLLKKKIDELNRRESTEVKIGQYQKYAELIFSQPNLSINGLDFIEVRDFEGNLVEIPLKKELSLKQNAERYYQKIKKLKEIIPETLESGEKTFLQYEKVKEAYEKLKKMNNFLEIDKFEKEYPDLVEEPCKMSKEPKNIPNFLQFEVGDGAVLFVGRNANNNEELTFKFARPNDYWFHARSVGGSHCVLKYSKGKIPPKEVIQKCAEIAAYFSKARNSNYVPVSLTQRKYIKKFKKNIIGAVVLMKEEVIFVEPKKPNKISMSI